MKPSNNAKAEKKDAMPVQTAPMQANVQPPTMVMMPPPMMMVYTIPPADGRTNKARCLRLSCIIYTSILLTGGSLAFLIGLGGTTKDHYAFENWYMLVPSIIVFIFGLVAVTRPRDWRCGVMAYGILLVVRMLVQLIPLAYTGAGWWFYVVFYAVVVTPLTILVFAFASNIPTEPQATLN